MNHRWPSNKANSLLEARIKTTGTQAHYPSKKGSTQILMMYDMYDILGCRLDSFRKLPPTPNRKHLSWQISSTILRLEVAWVEFRGSFASVPWALYDGNEPGENSWKFHCWLIEDWRLMYIGVACFGFLVVLLRILLKKIIMAQPVYISAFDVHIMNWLPLIRLVPVAGLGRNWLCARARFQEVENAELTIDFF